MANVLIIATDGVIGGLLGQLADLIGHAAQFRRNGEPPSSAVQEVRPDVVMVDVAYGPATLDAVAAAAADVAAPVVYFGATVSPSELRRIAAERGAQHFALPAGPRLLASVLESALQRDGAAAGSASTARDAVSAAAEAVSHSRALAKRSQEIQSKSRALRAEHESTLADCRRTRAELREAVIAYTRQLRGAGVPPDRALELVKEAIRADAFAPERAGVAPDLDDAVEWCLQAYYAA
jgi:chemotaxis response regulator CheB